MAVNYVQPGDTLTAIAPAGGAVSGQLLLIGPGMVSVSLHTKPAGGEIEVAVEGVYDVPKDTPLVINQFDKLYLNAGKLNKTNTGTYAGYATKAAVSAGLTVNVKLNAAI